MTKREWQERERQDKSLAALGIGEREADSLRRISRKLGRIGERQCSEEMSERAAERLERECERLEARARKILSEAWSDLSRSAAQAEVDSAVLSASAPALYYQSDPRGVALYVVPPSVLAHFAGRPLDSIYNSGIAVY